MTTHFLPIGDGFHEFGRVHRRGVTDTIPEGVTSLPHGFVGVLEFRDPFILLF